MSEAELEILKQDGLGRVRVPRERREALLDVFEGSGLSGQAFAQRVGVKYPTFAGWLQRRKRERPNSDGVDRSEPRTTISLVEAVVSDAPGEVPGSVSIETSGGLRLTIHRRADIALAVELLTALGAGSKC
ncbi:MAG: hypothetical protein Q7P63_01370 [Verrucomicrobiota bacterium JB022]|nr:hypothetical protein [Verrucomicrobiota bacterium JB022]